MKHVETINSRSWARNARRHCRIRRLGEAYKFRGGDFIHAWVHTLTDLGWIQARPCYTFSGVHGDNHQARRIVRTGGWIIRVRPQDSKYLLSHRNRLTVLRVPGPVDLDKLARYMGTAETILRETRRLTAARERLYAMIEARQVPEHFEEIARAGDLPTCYQDMTEQHCLSWAEIAKDWPEKEAA